MDEEYEAVTGTLNAFYTFHEYQYARVVTPKSSKYESLSTKDQELLSWYPDLVRDLKQCVEMNKAFLQDLAIAAATDWGIPVAPSEWAQPSVAQHDRVRSTLLQMSREWSADGHKEREDCLMRLVAKACELFPESQRESTKVLVPGCGLGRLVYEFVKKGFWTQGNEVSYHMILASGFFLNHIPMANSHTIFPFIHSSSHAKRRLFQVRPLLVPDESPLATFCGSQSEADKVSDQMSMTVGSFTDLYGPKGLAESEKSGREASAEAFRSENEESFDIIATCFFLDTAHNVVDYLKSIHHCLKKGGKWLNIGPLHWHFESDSSAFIHSRSSDLSRESSLARTAMMGLELSRDELLALISKMGFRINEHLENISTTYSSDIRASSKFLYSCDFWVAENFN